MLEKQIDGIVMTSLGCPLERRGDGLAALVVDFGAVFDEELAHGVLIVNGGPL